MKEKDAERIIEVLSGKIKEGSSSCEFCGNNQFVIHSHYLSTFSYTNTKSIGVIKHGEPCTSVPSILIICENCGYMMQFALGVVMGTTDMGD